MRCEKSKQPPLIVKHITTRYGILFPPSMFLPTRNSKSKSKAKKVTSKSRKLEDFDLIIVDFSTSCLSRKVEIGK